MLRNLQNRINLDESTGCMLWTGCKLKDGYGRMYYAGKVHLTHRVSAHCFLGFDLNSPQYVLHRCDRPSCINPLHLYIGTQTDNMRDMLSKGRHYQATQTHCKRGHEFNGENTYFISGGKGRMCKTCNNLQRKQNHIKDNSKI